MAEQTTIDGDVVPHPPPGAPEPGHPPVIETPSGRFLNGHEIDRMTDALEGLSRPNRHPRNGREAQQALREAGEVVDAALPRCSRKALNVTAIMCGQPEVRDEDPFA